MPQSKKPHWRLSKTLSRKTHARPIEDEDVRYVWAAYKAGALASAFREGLSAQEFTDEFVALIASRYDAAWALLAETAKGFIPAGLALGFFPHAAVSHFLIFNSFVWFPWATKRNRVESAVSFFEKVGKDVPMLAFARDRDKAFGAMIAKHGVLRRVGTSENVFGDGPASVWETR